MLGRPRGPAAAAPAQLEPRPLPCTCPAHLGQDAGALAAGVADVRQALELHKARQHNGGEQLRAEGRGQCRPVSLPMPARTQHASPAVKNSPGQGAGANPVAPRRRAGTSAPRATAGALRGPHQRAEGHVGVAVKVHLAGLVPLGHVGAAAVQQLRGERAASRSWQGRQGRQVSRPSDIPQSGASAAAASSAGCCLCASSAAWRAHRGQQDARAAGHGQAAVEDLGMHVPAQLLGGAAQAQGIKAEVCTGTGRQQQAGGGAQVACTRRSSIPVQGRAHKHLRCRGA